MKRYLLLGLVTAVLAIPVGEAAAQGRGGGRGGGGGGGRPAGGGGGARPAAAGAYGGGARPAPSSSGASRGSGSYTTQGGTTVKAAGAGTSGTTARGTDYGRGAGAVQVTTPGGQTATRVGSGGVAQGPGGATVGGSRGVAAASGPGGSAVSGYRGGAAVGPNGAVAGGSRAGGVSTAGGTWSGAAHGGAAVGPYGGVAVRGGAAVAGPGGVAARHATVYATPTAVAARATTVRGGYAYHSSYFNSTWYAAHPVAWRAAGLTAAAVWATATYATAASYCGAPAEPVSYDYGSTIVYQEDAVYQNGEQVATAEEYATQATTIADTGREAKPAETDEWKPLGVFGLVQGEETVANTLFQLAVNKAGVIRGNYYDALGDNTLPVFGSVDTKTGRAAWSVGEKKEIVYEAGLANLTNPECAVLIHYGKDKTRQMTLVRLEEPKDKEAPPK